MACHLTSFQTFQLLLYPQKNPLCISIGKNVAPAASGILKTCHTYHHFQISQIRFASLEENLVLHQRG